MDVLLLMFSQGHLKQTVHGERETSEGPLVDYGK